MQNRWNEEEAQAFGKDDAQAQIHDELLMRVYSSRLLGADPALVLHGGGNTSLKAQVPNFFGEAESLLYVKGSGWDLATIEAKGFAPVKMDVLLKLARLKKLSDSDMVRLQKAAMTDPAAPTPSVEAILHALIPFRYVDHTHADAIVAISNTPHGAQTLREIYGERVLYIPYVMPGFDLARTVFEITRDVDWSRFDGMVLEHHGIFSYGQTARQSYDRMIALVSQAEAYLKSKKVNQIAVGAVSPKADPIALREGSPKADQIGVGAVPEELNLKRLAQLRREISKLAGTPMIARFDRSGEARSYSLLPGLDKISGQGPLTPDHVIHTKRVPLVLEDDLSIAEALRHYGSSYQSYFDRNAIGTNLKRLDPAPRFAVWKGQGAVSFGVSPKRAQVVSDIVRHTMRAQQWSEGLGGWVSLPEKDIFDVEYWELEQAKLRGGGSVPPLQGKIAFVTGAASGIGRATVESLLAQGAAVCAVDINPEVKKIWKNPSVLALEVDLTRPARLVEAVKNTVSTYGGLDIVVANAGIFPLSQTVSKLDDETWNKTFQINLTSQMQLFRESLPYLSEGIDPTILIVASKNVIAPGPGAAAYSASKAALTQLARVAALEFAPLGIRVNMVHPHAVMDTGIWTQDVLEARARNYKMTIDQYKKNNLLGVELNSRDLGELLATMAGPVFSKITGAQITVDGGSDRTV